jgi:hypothetical protein
MVALVALIGVLLVAVTVYFMRRLANVERTVTRAVKEVRHQVTPGDLNDAFGHWVSTNPDAVMAACTPYINRSVAVATSAVAMTRPPPEWARPPHEAGAAAGSLVHHAHYQRQQQSVHPPPPLHNQPQREQHAHPHPPPPPQSFPRPPQAPQQAPPSVHASPPATVPPTAAQAQAPHGGASVPRPLLPETRADPRQQAAAPPQALHTAAAASPRADVASMAPIPTARPADRTPSSPARTMPPAPHRPAVPPASIVCDGDVCFVVERPEPGSESPGDDDRATPIIDDDDDDDRRTGADMAVDSMLERSVRDTIETLSHTSEDGDDDDMDDVGHEDDILNGAVAQVDDEPKKVQPPVGGAEDEGLDRDDAHSGGGVDGAHAHTHLTVKCDQGEASPRSRCAKDIGCDDDDNVRKDDDPWASDDADMVALAAVRAGDHDGADYGSDSEDGDDDGDGLVFGARLMGVSMPLRPDDIWSDDDNAGDDSEAGLVGIDMSGLAFGPLMFMLGSRGAAPADRTRGTARITEIVGDPSDDDDDDGDDNDDNYDDAKVNPRDAKEREGSEDRPGDDDDRARGETGMEESSPHVAGGAAIDSPTMDAPPCDHNEVDRSADDIADAQPALSPTVPFCGDERARALVESDEVMDDDLLDADDRPIEEAPDASPSNPNEPMEDPNEGDAAPDNEVCVMSPPIDDDDAEDGAYREGPSPASPLPDQPTAD